MNKKMNLAKHLESYARKINWYRIYLLRKKYYSNNENLINMYDNAFSIKKYDSVIVPKNNLRMDAVEINKTCNLDCIMCLPSLSSRNKKLMDMDVFEKSLIEAKRLGRNKVSLFTINEPLIHPNLEDIFKLMRKHRMTTGISTNGLVLGKKLDLLYSYTDVVRGIRFSVDGATKEIFEKIRKPGKFDKLIENMDYFHKEYKKRPYFALQMSSMVTKDNQHEMAYHLKFYSKYLPLENIGIYLINGLSLDNSYFFESSSFPSFIERKDNCQMLMNGLINVNSDGNLTPCCRDYDGDLVYGNIKDGNIEDLSNNKKIQSFRQQHLNGIPPTKLCANCYKVNDKLLNLYHVFYKTLIHRNCKNWDVEKMQKKFDSFFELNQKNIMSKKAFLELINN